MLKYVQYPITIFFLLVLLTGCAKNMPTEAYRPRPGDISGAWVRSFSGGTNFEGFFLNPDGSLLLVNIFSMQGDSWFLEKDKLTLFTHTERYPQPEAHVYRIETLSDKEMVLVDQDVRITYRRPASGTALLATRWIASFVPGLPAESPPEKEVSFSLRSDGRIAGFAGCNTFSGLYTVSGETIKFGALLSTKMFCPAMAIEDNLFRALGQTDEFRIIEDQLYLYHKNILQGFFKAKQKP